MVNTLLIYLLISVAINVIVFFIAYLSQSDKFTDITYSLTFMTLITYSFFKSGYSITGLVLLILVYLWAIRLGLYLYIRINYFKKDRRFDGRRERFFSFLAFFLLQGVSVFIILLPSLLYFESANSVFNIFFILGVFVWIKGFIFESVADTQKFRFIKNVNKSKTTKDILDYGLFRYSRHPNYFGEILCWTGVFLMTAPTLYINGWIYLLLGFISPLFIFILLRYVSGIPLLEKSANKRYKNNKRYSEYKKKTPLLVPKFFTNGKD